MNLDILDTCVLENVMMSKGELICKSKNILHLMNLYTLNSHLLEKVMMLKGGTYLLIKKSILQLMNLYILDSHLLEKVIMLKGEFIC